MIGRDRSSIEGFCVGYVPTLGGGTLYVDVQLAWPRNVTLMGIYASRCLADGRVCVGQSRRIYDRWRDHLMELRHGRGSPRIQKMWVVHGPSYFIFEILEIVLDSTEAK